MSEKYCWCMRNHYGQRLHLFSRGYTHFIKRDSHCDYGLVLYILEVSMYLTDQIKCTQPLWQSVHYWTWVSLWADKTCAHMYERPRHPSETSRCGQRWPFIFISFILLFSFFTQAHTHSIRSRQIIGMHSKKWQGWQEILRAIKAYQPHFEIFSVNWLSSRRPALFELFQNICLQKKEKKKERKNRNHLRFLFGDLDYFPENGHLMWNQWNSSDHVAAYPHKNTLKCEG